MDLNLKSSNFKNEKVVLTGTLLTLRPIEVVDCTDSYVEWLNDPQVNQYLETRFEKQSIESVKSFVSAVLNDKNSVLFAMVENRGSRHIGNIKIGPINWHHRFAEISFFIGEKSAWGKGFATAGIQLITDFALKELKLNKTLAGVYETNKASEKALLKAGYKLAARFKRHLKSNSGWEDKLMYEFLGPL